MELLYLYENEKRQYLNLVLLLSEQAENLAPKEMKLEERTFFQNPESITGRPFWKPVSKCIKIYDERKR